MAKKNSSGRKPGGAAGIAVVDHLDDDLEDGQPEVREERPAARATEPTVAKPERKPAKEKAEAPTSGAFSVADIRKAAAFVNSVGGLDKAMAVLQILKVAKEVQ